MKYVLVQASSRSWQGWPDFCTNEIEGKACVQFTVDKFLAYSNDVRVILIAPEFDYSGAFADIFADYPKDRFELTFSHDNSPLRRMVQATNELLPNDYFIRVDGLHFAVLIEEAMTMLQTACDTDCVKFPDDFPIQLTADVYRVGALRNLLSMNFDPVLSVHPKWAFLKFPSKFSITRIPKPQVSDKYLHYARNVAKNVYVPRLASNVHAQSVGDLHSFHYELIGKHLQKGQRVLDCSSGCGEGSNILALTGANIVGGDIDVEQVNLARMRFGDVPNIEFSVVDITKQPFDDNNFDSVICLETIEHVDELKCCKEIWRVLKPGGLAVFSTPQNSLGHIPINPMHKKEYSLQQLITLLENFFTIEKIIAVKQGKIIIEGDNFGSSSIIFCRKK